MKVIDKEERENLGLKFESLGPNMASAFKKRVGLVAVGRGMKLHIKAT